MDGARRTALKHRRRQRWLNVHPGAPDKDDIFCPVPGDTNVDRTAYETTSLHSDRSCFVHTGQLVVDHPDESEEHTST